jgi:hypothetical protein
VKLCHQAINCRKFGKILPECGDTLKDATPRLVEDEIKNHIVRANGEEIQIWHGTLPPSILGRNDVQPTHHLTISVHGCGSSPMERQFVSNHDGTR